MAQVTFEENIKELKMSDFVSFCVLCQCRVGPQPSIIYQGDTFSVWCCGIDPQCASLTVLHMKGHTYKICDMFWGTMCDV